MLLTHNQRRLSHRKIPLARLPEALHGFRLVQISDLHFYEYSDLDYYRCVVEDIGKIAPHAIVLTGDVVHYGPDHIYKAKNFLAAMPADCAKLAILGNHDYQDGARSENITAMLDSVGFTLLKNSHVPIAHNDARLWFAGLDDLWYGKPDIAEALRDLPSDAEPVVMLAHNPLLFDPVSRFPDATVDLVLSGHTHAGHVYIPFLGPIYRRIFRMKYRYGLYQKHGCTLHVSSGLGSAAFYLKQAKIGLPRFRYNTHPEIALLELVSGD